MPVALTNHPKKPNTTYPHQSIPAVHHIIQNIPYHRLAPEHGALANPRRLLRLHRPPRLTERPILLPPDRTSPTRTRRKQQPFPHPKPLTHLPNTTTITITTTNPSRPSSP